jgi:acyl-CoA dehydrogenase
MTSERTLLVNTARAICRDLATPQLVAAAEETGWSPDLWAAVAGSGFPWVSLSEDVGGSGGTIADMCALLGVAGSFAAPVPLAESGLLAGWALTAAGMDLPEGPSTTSVGHPGDVLELTPAENGWRLRGQVHRVPWGQRSDVVALLVEHRGEAHVVAAPTTSASITAGRNLAGDVRDSLTFDGAWLPASAVAAAPAGVDHEALALRGALSRAALISGALQRVVDLTVSYTGRRHQFGRPVARFQAVQRHLVRIAEESQACALSVAAAAVGEGVPAFFETAAAKIVAGQAATLAAAAAHQAHGAMGMTKEYELAQLTRRLWAWRDEFGREQHWSQRLGDELVKAGADSLWPRLADGAIGRSPAGA